jgi:hypothetical protein
MPKAIPDENGFSFSFYSNDHLPMHVHAKKGGEECVFLLGEVEGEAPSIRENKGMSPANVRIALGIVQARRDKMVAKWQEHLG